MTRTEVGTLIWSEELKQQAPMSQHAIQIVKSTRDEIGKALRGDSDKKIMIIWPCSADFESSLIDYAKKLKEMKEQYGDKIIFLMRFYTWKPRTIGGWKWIQQWPIEWNIDEISMNEWLLFSRQLAIKLMEESGIALADEMLHPQLYNHFDDIFAYQAIGARSVENQYHREVSSGANIAIGLKNPTSWSLMIMANSIEAAQNPSRFTIEEKMYASTGNTLAHGILRGWDNGPNFSKESIQEAYDIMIKRNIQNHGIIIDCSHENCKIDGKKQPLRQIEIMNAVMESIKENPELKKFVKWFMVESYIYDGNQSMPKNIDDAKRWLSLTDPCIGIEWTGKLLKELHEKI
jgi:3-deoxy-7-phosphoheptulonate synthase